MRRLLPLLLTACAPAVEAPEDVESLMVFGFVHFDDDAHLEAMVDPVFAWLDTEGEQLTDEGYAVDLLTADDLADVGVPDPDTEGVIGALGAAAYRSDVDTVADGITHPEKDAIYEGTTAWTIVEEEGDRDCFLTRACRRYAFTAEEENRIPVLGRSWKTTTAHLRWVTPPSGGPDVLAMRQLTPEPIDFGSPVLAVDQQYGFSMLRPEADGTTRVEALWVDARVVGLELPEGWAVAQAVGRMQQSADDLDAFFAGEAP